MVKGTVLAIASGKGGTGKTTVAANLALTAMEPVQLLDCDVEEPNAALFLKPILERRQVVTIPVPEIRLDDCDGCGFCARACPFGALVMLGRFPYVAAELCKGCGACLPACPAQAIREVPRAVGLVEEGSAGAVRFAQGQIQVGETSVPLVIRAIRRLARSDSWTLVDAPPGTSCGMTAAVRGADFALLVTEPTPFGLHDLELAVESARRLNIPHGVVVNRHVSEDRRVQEYCRREQIPLLAELPDDRRAAEAYSRGENISEVMPEMKTRFVDLWQQIQEAVG